MKNCSSVRQSFLKLLKVMVTNHFYRPTFWKLDLLESLVSEMKLSLHLFSHYKLLQFKYIRFDSILSLSFALCGLIMIPPWLNTRSRGELLAVTDSTLIAGGKSLGRLFLCIYQPEVQAGIRTFLMVVKFCSHLQVSLVLRCYRCADDVTLVSVSLVTCE